MAVKAGAILRPAVRAALVAVAVVLTAPLWLPARLQAWLTGGEGVFAGCSEVLSLFPGLPGVYLRRGFYRMCLEACALDCHIGFGTTFAHREVGIGRGVIISNHCIIGRVVIEDGKFVGRAGAGSFLKRAPRS